MANYCTVVPTELHPDASPVSNCCIYFGEKCSDKSVECDRVTSLKDPCKHTDMSPDLTHID